MKKLSFVLAAAGLMSLAACHKAADTTAVNNEAEVSTLDNTAAGLDNMAAATTNDVAANALENASASVSAASDNIAASSTNAK